jgi:hypothetical protein
MTDFFASLAARGVGAAASATPRGASAFEVVYPGLPPDFPQSMMPSAEASRSEGPSAAEVTVGTASRNRGRSRTASMEMPEPRSASESINEDRRPLLVPPPPWDEADRVRAPVSNVDRTAEVGFSPRDPSEAQPVPSGADASGLREIDTSTAPAAPSSSAEDSALPPRRPPAATPRRRSSAAPAAPLPLDLAPKPPLTPATTSAPAPTRPPTSAPTQSTAELRRISANADRAVPLPLVVPRVQPLPVLVPSPTSTRTVHPRAGETPAPVIRVSIGRIEVRAAPAQPAPATARPARTPRLTLADYLHGAR